MGSKNPAEPLAGTLIATTISTISAVFITRWLSPTTRYRRAARAPTTAASRRVRRPKEAVQWMTCRLWLDVDQPVDDSRD